MRRVDGTRRLGNRHEVIDILDGTHPTFGRGVAFGVQALIIISALSIALETIEDLPVRVYTLLRVIEVIVLGAFALEYVLRIVCAHNPVRYVFSFWGLVDLLACLPALALLQTQWAAIRVFRLMRLVRLLKLFRSNRALDRFQRALSRVRGELTVFLVLAAMMLYVAAVGIFIFEHPAQPEVFTSIPKSLWWAMATFTTVGYGDMVPITVGGRLFTALILFVGLGIVAVPAALITTALVNSEIDERMDEVEDRLDDATARSNRGAKRPKK